MLIRNYLNYSGSKDRYYPVIRKYIENAAVDRHTLIDLFCGSGVVAFNSMDLFRNVLAIDKCKELIDIHKYILRREINILLTEIDEIISEYNLSKLNREGFYALREDYNNRKSTKFSREMMLYCLITHSFNYSLHMNKKGEFNAPFGFDRSFFSPTLRRKLISYKDYITPLLTGGKSLNYVDGDSLDEFNTWWGTEDLSHCVFFIDPPYSACISKHPYRVGNVHWKEDEDRKLFSVLDKVHAQNGRFVFTNVLENNGAVNLPLIEWSKNYRVNDVGIDYSNCNYQRKNNGETREVIITNF